MDSLDFWKDASSRQTNIELLRIIAMLSILFCHYAVWGETSYEAPCFNSSLMKVYRFGGAFGNNVFMLIAGYFLTVRKGIPWEKIFRLIAQVTFYSVLLYFVSALIGDAGISVRGFLKALFPLFFGGGYWFFVAYICLLFARPIISAGLDGVSKNTLAAVLGFAFFCFVAAQNVLGRYAKVNDLGYNDLTWMAAMVALGFYIGKFGLRIEKKPKAELGLLILVLVFSIAARIAVSREMLQNLPVLRAVCRTFSDGTNNAVLPFATAVLTFSLLRNVRMKQSKVINSLASSAFGVYLFHNNVQFRSFLWTRVIRTVDMQNSAWVILWSAAAVCMIYLAGFVIDMLRKRFLEQPLFQMVKRRGDETK